jgi:DNA polymerase-3 subunit epsilon
MIDRLIEGIEQSPAQLLDKLEERMLDHALHQRFEEAGWLRDRHRALATSIERRQAWQALAEAGRLELSDGTESVAINAGRLVAAWRTTEPVPLLPLGEADNPGPVPPTVGVAEEAHLIWKWLCRPDTRIVEADGPIALPASGIPQLAGAA